jgi:transcriptional regulator with XRE-family HTH domain
MVYSLVNQKISSNIRIERLKLNYSQEYMAVMLNMSQNNYSKIERGGNHIKADIVLKIAGIFKINVLILIELA